MARKKKDSIKLSKKHGLQPTIPLCMYCGTEKSEIALLGAAGDKLAKHLGRESGEMPMTAHIPGDLEPCDDCREKAVMLVEVVTDNKQLLTGRFWGVKRDRFPAMLNDQELIDRGLKTGVMLISEDDAKALGLHNITAAEEPEE